MIDRLFKHPATPWIAPFIFFMLFLALEGVDPDKMGLIYVLYPLKALFVGGVLWYFHKSYPPIKFVNLGMSILIGLIACALWTGLDPFLPWLTPSFGLTWERTGGFNPFSLGNDAAGWLLVAFRLAGAVLIVPLMEELFWRGWLMRWIIDEDFQKVKLGAFQWKSFLATTLAFSLVHPQVFIALLIGLLYGWWFVRTKSLWDVVLAHAVTNLGLGISVLVTGKWFFW